MNPIGKKFISLFLVFSLVMLSVNLHAKERRGAKLIITKKDGHQVEGELITVKPSSLLLLDTEGKDVSIDIGDIKLIKIVKKSKVGKGLRLGLLIGTGSGALLGLFSRYREIEHGIDLVLSFEDLEMRVLMSAVCFGFIGLLIGGFFGAVAGIDKTIQIEGRHPSSIEFILKELRKKARIRDYK